MESWVALSRKEGRTIIQISAEPGIEPGTFWLEGRDLTNCANHGAQSVIIMQYAKQQIILHDLIIILVIVTVPRFVKL